ncbi:MAG: LysM peptidoglycan-binding domain-containing protein [Myxococcaceae bacterium]|nr:LysM peptidoglycan-binding domain-containing protein [Myxococcaceae bacterium]
MSDYTIRRGDTLSALARRFHTTVQELAQRNGIKNPDLILAGANLTIPDGFSGPGRAGPDLGGQSAPGTEVNPANEIGPPPGDVKGGVSLAQLKRIMPNLSDAKAQKYLPYLNQAMAEQGINTPKRQAAFLAQLAHESGELKYMEEIASGSAYEGRRDLGNTQPGDGVRFKGRGPIQLTGRANYAAASRALGIDLVNHPERAADPDVGFRIATWFWKTHGLNQLADQGNFSEITHRINGGYNGASSRNRYWETAKSVLGG